MTTHLRKLGPLLAVAILLFTHATTVTAETGSIGIIPAFPKEGNLRSRSIFIHTLKGGETVEDGVRVYNYTKEPRTVKVDAVDSIAASDGSFSCKQNSEEKTAVGSWIVLTQKEVTIPAESNELVKFTITVPAKAGPGEHGACITAQDTKNIGSKGDKGGIVLGFRNAIRVAITVPGKIVKELTITKVEVKRSEKGGYTISPVSRNTGNVSLDVTSRVQLRGMFGEETKIQSATYPVIAGATTGWAFEFKQPYWGGFYKAYTSIAYDADPTSGLGDKTGDEKKVRKITEYFFMMPTTQALLVELCVPLLALFTIVTYLRRRHRRKTAHKHLSKYVVQQGDSVVSIAKNHGVAWKRLSRINGLKAPYLLTEHQTLLIPKTAERRLFKRRYGRSKGGWVVEDSGSQQSTNVAATTGRQNTNHDEVPVGQYHPEDEPIRHNDWVAPRSASPNPRYPVPHHVPNPQFPEPDDSDIPDWREGASEDELAQLGVLSDSSTMPALSSTLNIDDEDESEQKQVKKPKKSAVKKTTTRKAKK